MAPDWQIKRGQISHSWLQNGVLVALNHALGAVTGSIRSRNAGQAIREDVSRWSERRREVPELLQRFESEMSPKVYFDRLPLSRCSEEVKHWLIPLTHELWLRRESVKELIATALGAYDRAEEAYRAVCASLETPPDSPASDDLRPVERPLRSFVSACETLSRSISALPHGIRCV